MKLLKHLLLTFTMLVGTLQAAENWNLIDKSMAAWNVSGGASTNTAWVYTKASSANSAISNAVTQGTGYVNIFKTYTNTGYNYAFLTPSPLTLQTNKAYTFEVKAKVNAIDKTAFPDIAPPSSGSGGFESNQISARLNNKQMSINLKYGDATTGYVTILAGLTHTDAEKFVINTSEWHTYRFVLHADNLKFDVYIDGSEDPVFENVSTTSSTGSNILRLGAESPHRCNMDIEYVKMGEGDFGSKPKITSLNVSSDSHIVNNERTITATINTTLIADGEKLRLMLIDKDGNNAITAVEATVNSNTATSSVTIPSTLPLGKYELKVSTLNTTVSGVSVSPKSVSYFIVDASPLTSKMLPQVKPVGFMIEIENYIFKAPSNEFIFPAIIDAKKYTNSGKFRNGQDTLARYYRYYTPHENPGGMYLATASSLDGPWTERNTVIDLNWAKAIPNNIINTATHISACQVIWNDVYNKYFMYFHGPNSATHYATSDNLVDWTFGGTVLEAKQFVSAATEASYAKVFEYTIPGLNNKYVLMLMIMQSNRKIYWAHSNDGVNWTPVTKPLVSPDLDYKKIPGTDTKPDYYSSSMGNNVAGPYLIEKNGRCFVLCNGSSGNICAVEIGSSFDMEVHWGEYLKASDVVIDTDVNGTKVAVPRVAAPVFIQNDEGEWYMFFEAGSRLGANIAYAKEDKVGTDIKKTLQTAHHLYPTLLKKGQKITLESTKLVMTNIEIYNCVGKKLYSQSVNSKLLQVDAPFSRGVYLVKITNENNTTSTQKIVVVD